MSTGISPTSSRQPFASGLPDTPPDTAHRADPAPPPQAEPANSPSRTLRDMARHNPYPGSGNSNGAAPTSAQPTQSTPLTPAQQAARQHNQALWQRLDPADQAQVRYQIERNFGPHALQDGIVRLEGKTIVTRAEYQKVKQDSHSKNPRIAQSARQQLASLVAIRSFNYGAAPDASARMGADIAARINAAHGTQIDFNELARYEGGQALSGY